MCEEYHMNMGVDRKACKERLGRSSSILVKQINIAS